MFGASKEDEIIGKVQKDFLHPDHHQECDQWVRSIRAGIPLGFVEQKWFKVTGEVFHAEVVSIDVELILQEVITLLSAQAVMKDVMIETEFEPNAPVVSCEESQLKQVFVNIIKNGIEAMPSGGRLFIRLISENDSIRIEFADEGEGIPEDRIPKLGEPFYSTKEKGTGLGLMVSHKIISSHHGSIDFSSKIGLGTTVRILLPSADPDESKKR